MSAPEPGDVSRRAQSFLEWAALILILSAGGYLRLANIAATPGLYTDEGTILNLAENLLHHRIQYFAIGQSMLLEARMPLFPLLLSGLFRIWGTRIEVLRALTGTLGILSILLVYVAVRRAQRPSESSLALLSAALYAVHPNAILYSRIGFSYNLLTPLVILVIIGLWEYLHTSKRGWLILASLSVGVGALSDLAALTLVLPVVVVISVRRWRDILVALPIIVLPLGLYVAGMLLTAPAAFLFDVRFTMGRLGSIPLAAQFPVAMYNIAGLLGRDFWIGGGIIGLFILRPERLRRLLFLLFALPLLSLARSAPLYGLGYYYVLPLFPFLAIGMASLLRFGVPQVGSFFREGLDDLFVSWHWLEGIGNHRGLRSRLLTLGSALALFIFVVTPFLIPAFTSGFLIRQAALGSVEEIRMSDLLINPRDARSVADFVNQHAKPDDLVIASPAWAWMIKTHVADFQQAIAYRGGKTIHYPTDIPQDRFEFSVDFMRARYVIVDNSWRNWGVIVMPTVREMVALVEAWPVAFEQGQITVFEVPEH